MSLIVSFVIVTVASGATNTPPPYCAPQNKVPAFEMVLPLIVTVDGVLLPLCVPIAMAPPLSEADAPVIVLPLIVTVALAPSSTLMAPPKEAICCPFSFPAPVMVLPSIVCVPLPTISIKPPA